MIRVCHDVLDPLLRCGSPHANGSDIIPCEEFVNKKFSLSAPLSVRIAIRVTPDPAPHDGEIDFGDIVKLVEESFGFPNRMAVSESKLKSLLCDVLRVAYKVDYVILILGLPGYAAVFVRQQHRRAWGEVERYVVAERSAGRNFYPGSHSLGF